MTQKTRADLPAATVVFPRRYNLDIPDCDYGWCRLEEVWETTKNVAICHHTEFQAEDLLDLVCRFAALGNKRRVSAGHFFYARTGDKEIRRRRLEEFGGLTPTWVDGIYVTEGWVKDVMKVIELGGTAVFYGPLYRPGHPVGQHVLLATRADGTFFNA
jgi:hypothetical protein